MKKNIIFVLLMAATALSSCDKFLESNPKDFLDPGTYYTDKDRVDAGLAGIYTVMSTRGSGAGAGYTVYGEEHMPYVLTVSDLEYYNGVAAGKYAAIFSFTSSDTHVEEYWRALYNGISRANNFIDNIEGSQITGVTVRYRDAAVGEAYALRAFYYLHLAANWGGVPLRATFDPKINSHVERVPLKDVYEQILKDLKKAEGMVYAAGEFSHTGRITKTTVQALLARACLYMAGEPLKETVKYGEAADWARKVKQSGLHTLNPSYANVFTRIIQKTYDLDYRESMWEAEFKGIDGQTPKTNGKWGGVNGVMCRDPKVGFAYAQIIASKRLDDFYAEDAGDKRTTWSVCPYDLGAGATAAQRPMNTGQRYPGKYRKEVYTGAKGNNYTDTNFPIMRYADVLLMLAEAANEADGPTDEAFEALNEVRRRAGVKECAGNAADPEKVALTTKEDFREFIKKERARELCFECTRRLDLIRWGDLTESVAAMSMAQTQPNAKRAGNNISEKHNLLPIPSSELNSNSLIEQNPDW